jgi:predicted RND superfamily exporter protein
MSSLFILLISVFYVKFDFNIKNLDYQNEKLINLEHFFKSKLNENKTSAILIKGSTIDDVISNAKVIQGMDKSANIPLASLLSKDEFIQRQEELKKVDFNELKYKITNISKTFGFTENYFNGSYTNDILFPPYPKYTLELVQELGFDLVFNGNEYFSYVMVDSEKIDEVLALDFTTSAQSKILFENSMKKVYDELLLFGSLTLILIISILLIVTKKRFLQAFTYILFPASLIVCYGIFVPLNIMHIFMGFVILAIGIDYGIYMNEKNLSYNSTLAIVYSLISTFAGFGVLIVSSINSLYSIATTAIIGILGIIFVLLFQKRTNIEKVFNQ